MDLRDVVLLAVGILCLAPLLRALVGGQSRVEARLGEILGLVLLSAVVGDVGFRCFESTGPRFGDSFLPRVGSTILACGLVFAGASFGWDAAVRLREARPIRRWFLLLAGECAVLGSLAAVAGFLLLLGEHSRGWVILGTPLVLPLVLVEVHIHRARIRDGDHARVDR